MYRFLGTNTMTASRPKTELTVLLSSQMAESESTLYTYFTAIVVEQGHRIAFWKLSLPTDVAATAGGGRRTKTVLAFLDGQDSRHHIYIIGGC